MKFYTKINLFFFKAEDAIDWLNFFMGGIFMNPTLVATLLTMYVSNPS